MSDHDETTQTGTPARTDTQHETVAELIRGVDVRAPQRLHSRVQEMVAPRQRSRRDLLAARLRPTLAAVVLAAAAGAAVALLTGGATRPLNVRDASALTLRASTIGAPRESATDKAQLDASVDGVAFPYWRERFGWRSTGARVDTLAGHRVTTVFYEAANGRRVGYAIVGGAPAPGTVAAVHSLGTVRWSGGVPYRLLRAHGAPVVVWWRHGRLCVLSGRGVSSSLLLQLAAWGGSSQVAYRGVDSQQVA